MLRLGGLAKGNMQQCIKELTESSLPEDFKLRQVRSLLRYLREVSSLVDHVKCESGYEGDTTSYLEILCAKEDSDLIRRVSHTRVLRQDFDEKRREWRKQKNSVINAIGGMTARALRFEDKERKTIALYALEYYKNVMGTDDGSMLGDGESTDGLIEQYRRHRHEISKIPMHADNIVKMLKDIRKTVRASTKLQPGSNAFAQFLDEWWSSVVQFLQHSSIVDAEKNAREVMQTLKTLKCKQEENKKKEMSRLLSKLDAQAGLGPPVGRLSELWMGQPDNPEETVANGMKLLPISDRGGSRPQEQHVRGSKRPPGNDALDAPPGRRQGTITHMKPAIVAAPKPAVGGATGGSRVGGVALPSGATGVKGSSGGTGLTVSFDCDEIRSCRTSILSVGAGSTVSAISSSAWEEGSVCTTGTDAGRSSLDTDAPGLSGIPYGDSDEDDDDVFEAADSFDLGAVDLCEAGADVHGQVVYKDQEEVRMASTKARPKKRGVEQERFSIALDYFRQEQHMRGRRPPIPPRPPSPMWVVPPEGKSPRSPLAAARANAQAGRKIGGMGVRIRPVASTARPAVETVARVGVPEEKEKVNTRGTRDAPPPDNATKASQRTLSLYIPRAQRTSSIKLKSKTPTTGSSARRHAPLRVSPVGQSGTTRATTRSVFFA